jgi:hypothetical protein
MLEILACDWINVVYQSKRVSYDINFSTLLLFKFLFTEGLPGIFNLQGSKAYRSREQNRKTIGNTLAWGTREHYMVQSFFGTAPPTIPGRSLVT